MGDAASPYAWKQIDKDEILTNAGAPTTSTAGTLGQLLTDTTNAKLYQLTAIDTTDPQAIVYTWTEVGGSSGPTVVQTTGTSTTDVMSQNAVTSMVYQANNKRRIAIGESAATYENDTIAIGSSAKANASGNLGAIQIGRGYAYGRQQICVGDYSGMDSGNASYVISPGSVLIGAVAKTAENIQGAIALGYSSKATQTGEMNIGSTDTSYGYNSSNYRLLTGLYGPQSAHDAANKQYVDNNAVGTTETLTIADTDWSALSSSDPYTYSATKTLTATIGANSTVSLINDAAVDFATYGFAIGSVDQPNNTITFYSIGAPSASKSLTINIKG